MLAARKLWRGAIGGLLFFVVFVMIQGGIAKADGWYRTTLNDIRVHTGPHLGDAVPNEVRTAGTAIDIVCQAHGDNVSWISAGGYVVNSGIWDQISSPYTGWVSDIFTTTPVVGDFSPGLAQCGAVVQPTYTVRASPNVNVRAGPDYASTRLGALPHGVALTVACQVKGRVVGTSTIWDQLSSPFAGDYVSDWWVNGTPVGVFDSRLPQCGALPTSTRETKAVIWAESQVGSTAWENLCDRFVATAYGLTHSGYYTALAHWNDLSHRGLAHPGDWNAPAGVQTTWEFSA